MSDDRYARVYFDRIEHDAKFDGIRNSRTLMGAWLMLLTEAEKAWPSPAFPPPVSWVPKREVDLFVERGLIDQTADGRYYVHGLNKEREARSRRASDAASARWGNANRNAERIAPSIANARAAAMPRREETRREETREARATDQAWETASGRTLLASGNYAFGYIDDAVTRHGEAKVVEAIGQARKAFPHVPETNALASAVKRILDPFPDAKAVDAEVRDQAEQNRSRRGTENTKRGIHATGWHEVSPDPACPDCSAL